MGYCRPAGISFVLEALLDHVGGHPLRADGIPAEALVIRNILLGLI
jgi:hypothetical protein